jgi:DNA polymerase I-like protein with 3'-5' exonuclease and polymerase domains
MTKLISFDFETHLIGYPDKVNPPGVCISFSTLEPEPRLADADHYEVMKVNGRDIHCYLFPCFTENGLDAIAWAFTQAGAGNVKLIAHNAAFDLHIAKGEIPEIVSTLWKALKRGTISDTMVREQLYLLSTKGDLGAPMSLAALGKRWIDVDMSADKDEGAVRYRYEEVDGIPISEWERDFVRYAIADTAYTLSIWLAQEEARAARGPGSMNQEPLNIASAYTLRGMTLEGIRTDPEVVQTLKDHYIPKFEEAKEKLKDYGIMNEKGTLSKKIQRDIIGKLCEENGVNVPKLTATGEVATDRETLQFLKGFDDPRIDALFEYSENLKACTTFIPQMDVERIHPEFNNIVKTLRTSCKSSNYHLYKGDKANALTATGKPKKVFVHSSPSMNFQQVPRDGDFRKGFIPDRDFVFIDVDYANLEFIVASSILERETGHSTLRELLNTGLNIHDALCTVQYNDIYDGTLTEEEGLKILKDKGHPEHERLKKVRQYATKQISLGVAGGLMVDTAWAGVKSKGYKDVTKEQVSKWLSYAKDRFPEFKDWFGADVPWNGKLWKYRVNPKRTRYIPKLKKAIKIEYCTEIMGVYLADRTRNQLSNCKTMQTPAALGMKRAIVMLYQKMEDPSLDNILLGSKLHANIHDEALSSVPKTKWEECMKEICKTMCDAMITVAPLNRITVEATVQDYWGKTSTEGYPVFEAYKFKDGELNVEEV